MARRIGMADDRAAFDRVRLDRVDASAQRIETNITDWLKRRGKRDSPKLRARLEALGGSLLGALEVIAGAGSGAVSAKSGLLYRAALAQERRLAVVERLFEFFRDRLDQRDVPSLRPILEAADEVTYSLSVQALARTNVAPMPPIAFVEAGFSPRALMRDEPPQELRTADELFRASFVRLPVGVIGLPPWCVEGPWTLVYLAHEIGHHVEVELGADRAVVKAVRACIAGAVPPELVDRFRLWSREIFADAFSVAMLGPVALESIVELERGDDAVMVRVTEPSYPCPAVRLALMAAVANSLGLDAGSALNELEPAVLVGSEPGARSKDQAAAAACLAVVPAVADALVKLQLKDNLTLAQVAALRQADFAPGGEVEGWGTALANRTKRANDATWRGTRRTLAGSWRAWRTVCAIPDAAQRGSALATLKDDALRALGNNSEPTTLGSIDMAEAKRRGAELGAFLLKLDTAEFSS